MAIGESVGVEEYQKAAQITQSTMDFIYNLLLQLSKKKNYVENSQKAAKQLLKHLKSGGKVESLLVADEDAALMRECLDKAHVTYMSISDSSVSPDKSKEVILICDKDRPSVEKAKRMYELEKGVGLTEVNIEELARQNQNKNLVKIEGLNPIQRDLFKKLARNERVVVSEKENPSTKEIELWLKSDDSKKADDILKNTMYELSGEPGVSLKKEINEYLHTNEIFKEKLNIRSKDEVLFVVDSKNPTNFISVQRDSFMTHSITLDENKALTDVNSKEIATGEKNLLMKYVASLNKPIVMTKEEMTLITGIDKKGNLQLTDNRADFDKELREMKENLKERKDFYRNGYKVEKELDPTHMYKYKNLSTEQCNAIFAEIGRREVQEAFVYDSALAFTENCKEEMKDIMKDVIYGKMDELEMKETELYLEGRGEVILSGTYPENQYILDANNPNLNLCINKYGFSLNANGKNYEAERLTDTSYDKHLLEALSNFQNPVILKEKEYNSPNREKIAKSRMPENQNNEAAEYLKNLPQRQRSKLMQTSYLNKYETNDKLSKREAEAVEELKKTEIKNIYVERSFVEKVTELNVEKKLVHDRYDVKDSRDITIDER